MGLDRGDIKYSIMNELSESPISFLREGTPSVHYNMDDDSDASDDEFDKENSFTATNEGRLSRALQSWMPDHVIVPLNPKERPPVEPVFSGRLGKERDDAKHRRNNSKGNSKPRSAKTANHLQRADSNESLETNISLLTCSSVDTAVEVAEETCSVKTKRRRKRMTSSRASTVTTEDSIFVSKWVELASKRQGIFDKFMRIGKGPSRYIGTVDISEESEAFLLFEQEEQMLVFDAGSTSGVRYVNTGDSLEKSGSLTNLSCSELDTTSFKAKRKPLRRVASTSSKSSVCKLDLAELKRQMLERKIAEEQARLAEKEKQRKGKRGSLIRNHSRGSIVSHLNQSTSSRPVSPTSASGLSQSVHSSDLRPFSPSERLSRNESPEEKQVSVWKGDREILEIDLKRELTARVKKKISSTRSALSRVSGLGEDNELRTIVGVHEEFPRHTEDDFSQRPRIIQRMRISPHLSGVIHDDIQVRMGRPRYHEIRVDDLELWNRGQKLDRAHRNLKVFNWLHSLRESQFIKHVVPDIKDELGDMINDIEILHIESADEPDVKPLYKAYEVRIL